MQRMHSNETALVSELGECNPDAPDLVLAISTLEIALQTRCDGRTAAVAIAKLCNTLQIATPPQEALTAYCEILAEYPLQLVELATKELIRHHRYPTFPKPADWLQYIEPPLNEKKAMLARLKRIQSKMRLGKKLSQGGRRGQD